MAAIDPVAVICTSVWNGDFDLQADFRRRLNFLEADTRNHTLDRLQVVDSNSNPPAQKLINLIDLWEQALLPI
jgi:hypothetical protein